MTDEIDDGEHNVPGLIRNKEKLLFEKKQLQDRLQKSEEQIAVRDREIERLNTGYARVLVENEANVIAARLAVAGSAPAVAPFLRDRIRFSRVNGEWTASYQDVTGQPMSLQELEYEFRTNKAMAPVIAKSLAFDRKEHSRRVAETLASAQAGRH